MTTTIDQPNKSREEWITDLYEQVFPTVAAFIAKKGGSLEDTRDIFQEAVVVLYEKQSEDWDFYQEKAYLFGIAKNLWRKYQKGNVSLSVLDDDLPVLEEDNHHLSAGKLLGFLETAGRKCMELLKSFYYDKVPMNQLARRFGFSGERSATVQKYKCLEKVRDHVKQRNLSYEDFLEEY